MVDGAGRRPRPTQVTSSSTGELLGVAATGFDISDVVDVTELLLDPAAPSPLP
ncbi:hypothetical protein ACIA8K_32945 [Catenuloplanes sp. NPDC051500]|uniref:hypothetical protein n=1 Tax=Catenuloplanes sp. NPDC051500 TaxID=3363959 RepID=UPI0037967D81